MAPVNEPDPPPMLVDLVTDLLANARPARHELAQA